MATKAKKTFVNGKNKKIKLMSIDELSARIERLKKEKQETSMYFKHLKSQLYLLNG